MLLAAAVALALLVPCQQRAIAKEVFFDPDSPAGKEYALPLDQARDEAAGVGKSDGPAGEKAPLFGEGVSKKGSDPGSNPGDGNGDGSAAQRSDDRDAGQGQAPDPEQPPTSVAAISNVDGHYPLSSSILWVAAILALGGIAGLALRVTQRS